MKTHRIAVLVVLAAATLAGAWMLVRPPEFVEEATAPAALKGSPAPAAKSPAPQRLAASSVLAIDPRLDNPLRSHVAAKPHVTLQSEYLRAKNYRALYDRLKSGPEGQTPEGWYVMYEMLRRCATVTDRATRAPNRTDPKRDAFIAAIPANDPAREQRIAAFDEVTANRCAGMEGITIAQADLDKMLANAAAAGDAKAQALSLEQQLWAERRASASQGQWGRNTTVSLTDAQVASLQTIAGTRDPEAMVIAGRILSTPWNDFSLRAGPEGTTVENRAFMQAWQLLACDYGYPCDNSNPRVQSGCAYQGHCNASSLSDYIFYYGASPNDSQLMSQYRDLLRTAIETGNWSQLPVARGVPAVPGAPPVNGLGRGG